MPDKTSAIYAEAFRLEGEVKRLQESLTAANARADAAEARAEKALAQRLVFDEALLREKEALAAARRECGAMRKALEPFAKMADGKDSWNEGNGCAVFATMAQVRAARAALASPAAGEEGT